MVPLLFPHRLVDVMQQTTYMSYQKAQFALVCSLCASFDAAGQRLTKRVLMKCQTRFYEVVAVKEIYRELFQKQVIPQTVADKITDSHCVKEARGHLFDHVWEYGTLDSLKVFCDVITSEKYVGYSAMQDLGAEMRRILEQEGIYSGV